MEFLNQYFGIFGTEHTFVFATFSTFIFLTLGYKGAPLWLWSVFGLCSFWGWGAPLLFCQVFFGIALFFNLPFLRRPIATRTVMKTMQALKLIPKISETEKAALNAGAVWVEKDFFSGKPDFKKLMSQPHPHLTPEEKAYLEGPIEELCQKIDDWKIYQNKEIPEEIWNFMKEIKIFGMIIPKQYGGLEFSALAHSEVIMKLSSRSIPVTITAMVPNSLGPAELLNHFGTEEQKNHYLPRLASGEDLPCFALTEQRAGSDAGSIESQGEVFEKDGKLYIRLNWNKRWITLAAVSTVLGLAFRLKDPQKLLGDHEDIGITCALIPSDTKGVVLGRRHDPLGVPFYNCPTQGVDVEIPVDWIIGGVKNAGKGWTMLMESLGAGRGISLPSQAVGSAKLVTRVTTAHSSIRKQFGVALCKLEGLEEPLARIGGLTYMLDAMRVYTLGALDRGIKPSVITAIAKHSSTELSRSIVNDGMDIMAGSGITRGPRNLIANLYQGIPIGITVEGANILTRTLIIFGQGVMRAHPKAFDEVKAIEENDVKAFDKAFWGHVGHIVQTTFRSFLLSITRGRLAPSPVSGPLKPYFQKLSWASASFAIMTDIAMATLGGKLKLKEKLTGRFADALSWMYLATSTLKRYQEEGSKKEDLAYVHWSLQHALYQIQKAFDGIFANFEIPFLGWIFSKGLRFWSNINSFHGGPSDALGQKVAKAVLTRGESRDRVTQGIYFPKDNTQALGRLEYSYRLVKEAEEVERKIQKAVRSKKLPKERTYKLIDEAFDKGIISAAEVEILHGVADARWDACQVDDFTEEAYHGVDEGTNKVFAAEYKGPAGAPKHFKYKKTA